jgi:hypothetical protein
MEVIKWKERAISELQMKSLMTVLKNRWKKYQPLKRALL